MSLIDRVIKPEIRRLTRMADTAPDRFDYLRLDKNERLLDFPDELMAELHARLDSDAFTAYPELGTLYERLAGYLGIATDQLYMTSGSDLAIRAIYDAAVGVGDEVVLHLPSYAMYRVYAAMHGAVVRSVDADGDTWQVDTDAMLALVGPATKLVAVEYPNGFLGQTPTDEAIERLADALEQRDVLLVVDCAYYYIEHSTNHLAGLVERHPNVVLVQTLSKAHGLAGARLGYVIAQAPLLAEIAKTRPMHEITGPTMVTAHWLLDHPELLTDYQAEIRASKDLLAAELAEIDIPMRDTATNFVLLYLPDRDRTADITAKLHARGIIVRRPFREPYLEGWSRVCVGTLPQMRRLLDALREIVTAN